MGFHVESQGDETRLLLGRDEVKLLRGALERASFIDTPPKELPNVVAFAARLLDALPRDGATPERK
jgi:hypothetical protein